MSAIGLSRCMRRCLLATPTLKFGVASPIFGLHLHQSSSFEGAPRQSGVYGRQIGRRSLSTSEKELAMQLLSIPEVKEAISNFEDGKLTQSIQNLSRAAEITASARMDQMTILTSDALAHVYRAVGDFKKEQVERAKLVELLHKQVENRDNEALLSSVGHKYFDALIQACVCDVTAGSLDEDKIRAARDIAKRIGYADADEHLQLCSFFEAASTLAGGDKGDAALLREHAGACEVALGATHSLSALGRLAEAAGLERAGKQEEARAGLARAGKAMTASVHTAEYAGVKAEVYSQLTRLALASGDLGEAKAAASIALQAGEAVNDNSLIASGVLSLAKVSVAQTDFIVGEGLLRTCLGRMQVSKGSVPTVWDLYLLQDATEAYAGLLEKIVFNAQSRKPEGDLAREKLRAVEVAFPVTAAGAKALRKGGLDTWMSRLVAAELPLLLK